MCFWIINYSFSAKNKKNISGGEILEVVSGFWLYPGPSICYEILKCKHVLSPTGLSVVCLCVYRLFCLSFWPVVCLLVCLFVCLCALELTTYSERGKYGGSSCTASAKLSQLCKFLVFHAAFIFLCAFFGIFAKFGMILSVFCTYFVC